MAASRKKTTFQVAVDLEDVNTSDWYPLEGTSANPVPEMLPHLMHSGSYESLTIKVRKRIKAEARKARREMKYKIAVEVLHYDPTDIDESIGTFLVANVTMW